MVPGTAVHQASNPAAKGKKKVACRSGGEWSVVSGSGGGGGGYSHENNVSGMPPSQSPPTPVELRDYGHAAGESERVCLVWGIREGRCWG